MRPARGLARRINGWPTSISPSPRPPLLWTPAPGSPLPSRRGSLLSRQLLRTAPLWSRLPYRRWFRPWNFRVTLAVFQILPIGRLYRWLVLSFWIRVPIIPVDIYFQTESEVSAIWVSPAHCSPGLVSSLPTSRCISSLSDWIKPVYYRISIWNIFCGLCTCEKDRELPKLEYWANFGAIFSKNVIA